MRVFIVLLGSAAASHFGLLDHWYTMGIAIAAGIVALAEDAAEIDRV